MTEAWARRTDRLTATLYRIAMMLAGEAGHRLAEAVSMPVSGDTLIRILRRSRPIVSAGPALGVDDWAWRRGQSYGTLVVDLQIHRPLDVLADRTARTLAAWLQAQPGVLIVARDRASDYARGIAEGAPIAEQVADRWHLLQNLRQSAENMCQRLRPELQTLPVATEMQRKTTWSAQDRSGRRATEEEARKQAVYKQRKVRFEAVQRLKAAGWSIKQIAFQLRVSWSTARNDYEQEVFLPMLPSRRRASRLDPHAEYLQARWEAGCRNANQLWREIRA